uniref:Complex 1 LYR protein domain-containing protein n=2 Tax=Equus TaxID=9789 RepID=A0A9L0QX90_HORSE
RLPLTGCTRRAAQCRGAANPGAQPFPLGGPCGSAPPPLRWPLRAGASRGGGAASGNTSPLAARGPPAHASESRAAPLLSYAEALPPARASPRRCSPSPLSQRLKFASSRAQVLDLYRAMLRESKHFSAYNYRTYAVRRIRDAFRENKNVKDPVEIQALVNKAKRDLEIIRRQVHIGQLYSTDKLIIETQEKPRT